MPEFKSWESFEIFERNVKRYNRYIMSPAIEDFLQTVLSTSDKRKKKIPQGGKLWRSQLGHGLEKDNQIEEVEYPCPFLPKRMKPERNMAREGRANPKGIPYLYLSTDRETSMAEVRPWVGSYISVGQFNVQKDILIIDCSVEHPQDFIYYDEEPPAKEKESAVWTGIDRSFSEPVNVSDDTADYVPTQIIAELFKANGFGGIAYKSLLGKGRNIVLFDLNAACLLNCSLFKAKKISFAFERDTQPYYVKKNSA